MKRLKTVSVLCKMGEHDTCDPRWTEDDASGLPTISATCVCACHRTISPEQEAKARAIFGQAKKEAGL